VPAPRPIERGIAAKPILAGYDPREADRAPVAFGVATAQLTGAPLIVALVEAGPGPHPIGQVDRDLVADCAQALAEVEADLGAPDIHVDCRRLQSTSAARALQEEAEKEDAGLVVIGSSRRSPIERVLAGASAMRLMHGSPCPVAIVPQGWTPEGGPSTIGVAYVNTEEGREALQGAYALARKAAATLRVITVVKVTPGMYLDTDAWRKEVVRVEGEQRAQAELELRTTVAALGADVPIDVDALVGDPAEVLVDVSRHLDLLVCGSRGYGPARAVLLGSVTRKVTAEAHCPVIVLARGVRASLEALVAEAPGAAAPA
jgi:nucleotide-binding universal stress UspA family protein